MLNENERLKIQHYRDLGWQVLTPDSAFVWRCALPMIELYDDQGEQLPYMKEIND